MADRRGEDPDRGAPPLPGLERTPSFWTRRRAFASLAVALVVAGGLAVVVASRPAPGGGDGVEFVTHEMTAADALGTHTGIAGALVIREGRCLYVSFPSRRSLAIWPAGTTIDERADPAVVRNVAGARLTAVGEIFSLSGWSIDWSDLDEARTYLDRGIPEDCAGSELLLIDPGVEALRAEPAMWRLDASKPPDPSSLVLHIEVEDPCPGAPDGNRALPPEIDYLADRIVITQKALDVGGRCRGNPYFPMTIELDEPTGNRILMDGFSGELRWEPRFDLVAVPHELFPVQACYPTYLEGAFPAGDAADGAVAWVTSVDGRRLNVLWPEGYSACFDPDVQLVGPINEIVARAGDELVLAGGFVSSGEFEACDVFGAADYRTRVGDVSGVLPWPTGEPPPGETAPPRTPRPEAHVIGRLHGIGGNETCSLVVGDRETWAVEWPQGYRVETEPVLTLIGPDGSVVAVRSDLIGVIGSTLDDPVQRCPVARALHVSQILFAAPASP